MEWYGFTTPMHTHAHAHTRLHHVNITLFRALSAHGSWVVLRKTAEGGKLMSAGQEVDRKAEGGHFAISNLTYMRHSCELHSRLTHVHINAIINSLKITKCLNFIS